MIWIASDVLLVLVTASICISDYRFHRVPNLTLFFLVCILIPSIAIISLVPMLFLILTLWVLGLLAKIGPGDLKLLTILIIMQGEIILDSLMWILFLGIAAISLLMHILERRSWQGEIPLAPAIVIPFTALYLSF